VQPLVCIEEHLKGTLAVDSSAIPQQDDWATKVAQKVLEKLFNVLVCEVT